MRLPTRIAAPAAAGALLLAASAALGNSPSDRRSEPSVAYTVRADARLSRLEVRVCFDGRPPHELAPGIRRAGRALLEATDERGRSLRTSGGRIQLSGLAADACVDYRVDAEVARRASGYSGRHGVDLVSSQGAWLWRDPRRPPRGGATVRFDLPAGVRVATPWPRSGAIHHLDASAFRRPGFVAFGRFRPVTLERHGVHVEAVRLGSGWRLSDGELRRWLTTAVDGVASVQGRFPVERLLVVLRPTGGRGVDFGMVRRGGGHSVGFSVGRRSSATDLERDWVTWHELSHLQLPALPQRDAWLYEGMATYYQEVLPTRLGIQPPREAWRELAAGFGRGARSRSGRGLSEAAETMRQTRAFSRVYWAGAAFALEADVRLRQQGSSLDAALTRGGRAWRSDSSLWTSQRVCAVLDRTLERGILRPLRDRYARRVAFPGTTALLRRLGVVPGSGGVSMRSAELSRVRDAIMAAPHAPPPTDHP